MNASPHILLVDDEPRFAESLQQILRMQNYPATIALSGEEALESLEHRVFDLVLLDIDLPQMNGVETLVFIKQSFPTMPVVMMTGNTSVETAVKTMKKGAYDYLKKPIVHDLLKTTIANALRHAKLERELIASEKRFKIISEASWEGVVVHNNGLVVEGNKQFFDIFGYEKQDIIRTNMLEKLFTLESQSQVRSRIEGCVIGSHEVVGVRKDGSKFPLEARSNFIEFQGQALRVCAVRDISERKRAEQENLDLHIRLAKASKMEALGMMAGAVAHDLNNILSGVVSFPELMLMEMDESHNYWESINLIQKAGKRAAFVVSDLITIARGATIEKTVKSPNTIITDHLSSIEHKDYTSNYQRVTISANLAGDLLNMYCSEMHLRKVLMNLIGNGLEVVGSDGEIKISSENITLSEPVMAYERIETGNYIKITISDNGSGISPQDIEHIFEPFYSKKIMGKSGTGLGLAIVWTTIHDHDGFIDVKSGPEGTSFELFIPSTQEKELSDNPAVSINALRGNGENILVVDDKESQCATTRALLENIGYRAVTVNSGEDALDICKKTHMDLVILDMILEDGMNGRETYEQLLKINPLQKAIVVSGFSENEEMTKIQELGVLHFVKKPYTLDQLGMAVKQSLYSKPN